MESTDTKQQGAGDEGEGDNIIRVVYAISNTNGGAGALLPPPRLDDSPGVVNLGIVSAVGNINSGRDRHYGNSRSTRLQTCIEVGNEPYLVKPEVRLCHAMFSRAVMDLSKKPRIAKEAKKWLFGEHPYRPCRDYLYSFENVCLFLGYDLKKTLARVQRYLDGLTRGRNHQVTGSTDGIPIGLGACESIGDAAMDALRAPAESVGLKAPAGNVGGGSL